MSDAFTFIGKPNGASTIPKMEAYELDWVPYDKYTSREMRYYVIDEYIYVYEPQGLEAINVRGVFEDPKEVEILLHVMTVIVMTSKVTTPTYGYGKRHNKRFGKRRVVTPNYNRK